MSLKLNDEVNGVAFKDIEDVSNSADEIVSSDVEISPMFSKKASQIAARIKRKAKRSIRFSTGEGCSTDCEGNGGHSSSLRDTKNSRRPRSRYGRGLPKKGGAGGKGTWGEPGSELSVEGVDINKDVNDPNYDSESQESCEFESIVPELTEDELERNLDPILMEYFEHGETQEVIISIQELNVDKQKPFIVVTAISRALEKKPSHREMMSILLSDLYGRILSDADIKCGFDLLLEKLPDLALDTPDAALAVGNFIARAIADDCLPPKYVQTYRGKLECPNARACLEHANTLLNMKHGLVRLDNVWGLGGGMRPVKYLIKQIQMLLKEYVCSGDVEEATRCLQELEVPHFHHEFVYEAIVMVIEDMNDKTMEVICELIRSMCDSVVVSSDQLKNGFERVYSDLPDICIDVPPAYSILKRFVMMCNCYGFMPMELIRNIPVRGRKRFVSEGDGGLIKE